MGTVADGGQGETGGRQAFEKGFCLGDTDSKYFAGGFHFRPKDGIGIIQFLEGENGHFDGTAGRSGEKPGAVSKIRQRLSQHYTGSQVHHGYAGHLGNIGDRTGSPGVHLNDIQFIVINEVLNVHKAFGTERQGKLGGHITDFILELLRKIKGRIHRNGVTAVHAGTLDMLHDPGNQYVPAVGDDVDLQFDARQVLVHKDRILNSPGKDPRHIVHGLLPGTGDGHILSADHIGRTQENRIAKFLRCSNSFLHGAYAHPAGTPDAELLQQFVKTFPVFGDINGFGTGAENTDSVTVQILGQLDRSLAAEGDHNAYGLFHLNNIHDIFGGKRLEIEAVRRVIVGGHGLRIVVDDDYIITDAAQGPDAVYGGIVEFDALADPDRAGAEHDDDRAAGTLQAAGFTGFVRAGIEVGRLRGELRTAGVDHLVAHFPPGYFFRTGNPADGCIRIAHFLEGFIIAGLQAVFFRFHLRFGHGTQAVQEETVDLCNVKDLIHGQTLFQGFKNSEEPAVILQGKAFTDRRIRQRRRIQRVQGDFRTADSFHQGFLKTLADGHYLAGGLHLGTQAAGRSVELIERPLREFDDDIIDGRLKAGTGFTGNVVGDFIQGIAERQARGDLCNRITGCLAGQRGRTADPGIDFDNRVFEGIRIQGKLAVAAADDPDGTDDIQRSRTEHLVFLVRKGQGRRDYDAVAGMNADRVHVFHRADSDNISLRIAHGFELNFLPACDTFLHQDLGDGGGIETSAGQGAHFLLVICDAAAAAAQRIGRTDNDRVTDFLRRGEGFLQRFRNAGGHTRLADIQHGFPELFPVFRFFNGFDGRSKQPYAELIQCAVAAQLHRQGQAGLAAKAGNQAVRAFLLNDPADSGSIQRLQVNLVRQMLICHDGCRVGIDENHIDAFLFEDAAGLGTGIVKFRCLADYDRTGTDHQYFPDGLIFRHASFPPSSEQNGRTELRYPGDLKRLRDGTGR